MVSEHKQDELSAIYNDCICLSSKGKPIKPKTVGQQNYIEKIKKNTIVFGVGPAGTGKTFLAVAMAVTALKQKQISRIVLTRPAVEAGEKLGFLPGDLQSKMTRICGRFTTRWAKCWGTNRSRSIWKKAR